MALRDASSRKPLRESYVRPKTWQPARDVLPGGSYRDRKLDPFALAQHVAGAWDVAAAAPSWSSWFVLDIDRHVPWLGELRAGELRADELCAATRQRDETARAVWRALGLGPDKQPVIVQTPSGGYHFYFPLLRDTPAGQEGRWPNGAMRRHVESALRAAEVPIRPGVLEIYPTNVPLRAPCGRGTVLVEARRPDDPARLRFEPVAGTVRGQVERGFSWHAGGRLEPQFEARRNIRGQVARFVEAIEAARRPLGAWLSSSAPAALWDVKWGPFGARTPAALRPLTSPGGTNESEYLDRDGEGRGAAVPTHSRSSPPRGGAASPGSMLLYGSAFRRRVIDLAQNGLTHVGERHDAALKLAFYWGASLQLPREEVLRRLHAWLERFPHVSELRTRSPDRFVRDTLREAMHYYDHFVVHCVGKYPRRQFDIAGQDLSAAEEQAFRAVVRSEVWPAARAVLRILRPYADASGRVGKPVTLSHRILIEVCGERRILEDGRRRRAHVVAVEELTRLGVLTLHHNYRVGHRARAYSVWYQFGSAQLPGQTDAGDTIVATRAVSEGLLSVLGTGTGALRVLLEPHNLLPTTDDDPGAHVCTEPVAAEPEPGPPWWRRMYGARVFTVGEFLGASEGIVLPGPWAWQPVQPIEVCPGAVRPGRPPPVATGPPVRAPRPPPRQLLLPLARDLDPRPIGCGAG